jgi:hypothetical protein
MSEILSVYPGVGNKKAAGFSACGFACFLTVGRSANHRRTSAEIKIITQISCVHGR